MNEWFGDFLGNFALIDSFQKKDNLHTITSLLVVFANIKYNSFDRFAMAKGALSSIDYYLH